MYLQGRHAKLYILLCSAHIIVNENRSVKRSVHFTYMTYLTDKIHFELVKCLHVSVGQYHILARMLNSMTFKIFEIKFLRYQSPVILTELFQHNLISVSYLTACYLYLVIMTLHFLNDVAIDAESTHNKKYVIIANLKSVFNNG